MSSRLDSKGETGLYTEPNRVAADALNRVAQAAVAISRLEPRLEDARRELYEAIREAHAEGASLTVIAKVAGLTRQRVHQIVQAE